MYDVHMLLMYRHTIEVLVNIPEKCAGCLLIPSDIRIMQSLCKLHPSIFGSVDIQDKTSCASCATNAVGVGMFVSHTVTIISLSCTDTCTHLPLSHFAFANYINYNVLSILYYGSISTKVPHPHHHLHHFFVLKV